MSNEPAFNEIAAQVIVPEQLVHYVRLVSAGRPKIVGPCLVYFNGDTAFVIGYPLNGDSAGLTPPQLGKTLDDVTRRKDLQRVVVISSLRPPGAPEWAKCFKAGYWHIPLPFVPPKEKGMSALFPARNKARPKFPVVEGKWTGEHADLAKRFAASNNLNAGALAMLDKLGEYLENTPGAMLFSVYAQNGKLLGCLSGDFNSASTAFYMLSFMEQQNLTEHAATNDSLMLALIRKAEELGKKRVFMGACVVQKQIQEYREKWGAREFMPMVETAWELNESGEAQERYYYNEMNRRKRARSQESPLMKLKRWIGF